MAHHPRPAGSRMACRRQLPSSSCDAPKPGVVLWEVAALLLWLPWPLLADAASVFCRGVETAIMFDPSGWKFEFDFGADPESWSSIG